MRPKHILIIDDDLHSIKTIQSILTATGFRVSVSESSAEAMTIINGESVDLIFMEAYLADTDGLTLLKKIRKRGYRFPITVMSGFSDLNLVLNYVKLDIKDFLKKPLVTSEIEDVISRTFININTPNDYIRQHIIQNHTSADFSILSEQTVDELISIAKNRGDRLLIKGEPWTGQRVAARLFSAYSNGVDAPFVVANCASFKSDESTEQNRENIDRLNIMLNEADEGTLFLDNLSALPVYLQLYLQEFLCFNSPVVRTQCPERSFNGAIIGSIYTTPDNQDPEREINQELLCCIKRYTITTSPLRERVDDILSMASKQIEMKSKRTHSKKYKMTKTAKDKLLTYPFHGNLQELHSIINTAIIKATDGVIKAEHIILKSQPETLGKEPVIDKDTLSTKKIRQLKKTVQALKNNNWNRRQAALELEISYDALRWRIKKYGIDNQ